MDTVFLWLSKIVWYLISPSSILVLWTCAAIVAAAFNRMVLARKLLLWLTVPLLLVAMLPVGRWLFTPLEARIERPELPSKVDGIVVLSGAELGRISTYWQMPEFNGAVERQLAFMALAKRYPEAKLIFTGASGSLINGQYSQVDVAKRLYEQQGLDSSRIIYEDKARNTAENGRLSHDLVKPKPGERWILITSAWHMPRSIGVFCKLDWPMIPYPVDHRSLPDDQWLIELRLSDHLHSLDLAAKEYVGLLAYYISGKTSALMPQTCLDSHLQP